MEPLLGIFPLKIVLFPEASYPLHIFEDKYRALIRDSLEQKRPFGINLIVEEKVFGIGCSVEVVRITREYPDGRRDIVVEGRKRYQIEQLTKSEQPYLTARTLEVLDEEEERDEALTEKTIGLFNELVSAVYGSATLPLEPDEWVSKPVSFRIAQKSGLQLVDRQQILEERSENRRLQALSKHLLEILPKVRAIDQVRKISRNDGYLPQA